MLTMSDWDGNTKYTACQRNVESKLTRHRKVLSLEKKRFGINELEASLCSLNGKSNKASEYKEYLVAKARIEKKMNSFYHQEKWRGFKFRIFCHRRSSEHKLLNRIACKYGDNCMRICIVKFGNWYNLR